MLDVIAPAPLVVPARRVRRCRRSIGWNNQGSIPPSPMPAGVFTYNAGGPGAGQMWLSVGWDSAFSIYRPDGSKIDLVEWSHGSGLGDVSALFRPPAPTLSQVNGGALGARTYYVYTAYVKNGLIYFPSTVATLAVSANNLLKVTSPAAKAGMDGWAVFMSNVSAVTDPYMQDGPGTSHYATPGGEIPFGTDWIEPTSGFANIYAPAALYSSPGWKAITQVSGNPGNTFYFYLYWDVANQVMAIARGWNGTSWLGITSKDASGAWKQRSDNHIPIASNSDGSVNATLPLGGSTGTGSGLGGGEYT